MGGDLSGVPLGPFVGLASLLKPPKVVVTTTAVPLYYCEVIRRRRKGRDPKGGWKWEERGAEGRDYRAEKNGNSEKGVKPL